MPYKSLAHMRFMHAKHPEIAKKWDKKYGTTIRMKVAQKKRKGA